jgi:uroporphyrin-III C-methyltransferase
MLELCPQAIQEPVGKRCGKFSSAQHFINKRLVDAAQKYPVIVRLKGGDPMMFGRADEEIQALKQAGIAVSVVPGITAALAGAAAIQQSLTLRGVSRSVAFVTLAQANETENTTQESTTQPLQNPNADTLVFYMGRKDASKITKQLLEGNSQHTNETPVHILEAVSTKNERHWSSTLGELGDGKTADWFNNTSPALIMVGEALREKLQLTNQDADQINKAMSASEGSRTKINNGLQNSVILSDSRRSA